MRGLQPRGRGGTTLGNTSLMMIFWGSGRKKSTAEEFLRRPLLEKRIDDALCRKIYCWVGIFFFQKPNHKFFSSCCEGCHSDDGQSAWFCHSRLGRVNTQQNKEKPLRFSLIIPAVSSVVLQDGFPHFVSQAQMSTLGVDAHSKPVAVRKVTFP